MTRKRVWNRTNIIEEAKKYRTRGDFKAQCSGAYKSATRQGFLDEACQHMSNDRKPQGYWTKNRVVNAAKKCSTRTEFSRKFPGADSAIQNNNWVDVLSLFGGRRENAKPKGYWTAQKIAQEAKRYSTKTEFAEINPGAHDAAIRLNILSEVCEHMNHKRRFRSDEEIVEAAKKYTNEQDFKANDYYSYSAAKRRNLLALFW